VHHGITQNPRGGDMYHGKTRHLTSSLRFLH
jgi:hypothetical protein